MIPQQHEVAGISFRPFHMTALVFCWVCGRCSTLIEDPAVHAGHHVGEDEITKQVRKLMNERENPS